MKNEDVMVAREGGVEWKQSNIRVSLRWERAEVVLLEILSLEALAEIIVQSIFCPIEGSIRKNAYGGSENLLDSNNTECFVVRCMLFCRKRTWKIYFSSHMGKRESTNHWKVVRK